MFRTFLLSLALMLALPAQAQPAAPRDPHSYANTDAVRVKHLALDLSVDFAEHTLTGSAELQLERRQQKVRQLVLDTRALQVEKVLAGRNAKALRPARFRVGKSDDILGAALTIELPEKATLVRVYYRTHRNASGLQWLSPEQTAGKQQPFLFTQSQAIHARSWVPLQDTPLVRFTFNARIHTPRTLRAVMGAENPTDAVRSGDYQFRMPQAIPSYLLALAVGDLNFAATGPRSGIFAEPSVLAAATEEFADTEQMIVATEALYGPYRWGRYDLLVLPPSFPFGGMENPRLTFASPTVIAGDKSLVALVAHELAHSWSGNLVTNATWRDFWLNESFTSYLTNRIMEAVFGPERGAMERVLEAEELLRDYPELPTHQKVMAPKTARKDPEDYASVVVYNHGSLLLYTLEQRYGREGFDAFLKGWFHQHAFTSQTTESFVAYAEQHLLHLPSANPLSREQLQDWLTEAEISQAAILPRSDSFTALNATREAWLDGKLPTQELPFSRWNSLHWSYFLDHMPARVSGTQLAELDQTAQLTASPNRFLQRAWLTLALSQNYFGPDQALLKATRAHVLAVGRTYLIGSVYEALAKSTQGHASAVQLFEAAKAGYHPITQAAIQRILKATEPKALEAKH